MLYPVWLTERRVLAGIVLSVIGSSTVEASGFALPELSASGLATANAMVANPIDPGAFAYNPAAMGYHDQSSLAVGALLIAPGFQVTHRSGTHDSNGADWIAIPMVQGALKAGDQWRIGLAINTPFGLETRWSEGTFPALTGSLPAPPTLPEATIPLSAQPTQSKLEVVDIVPTATYRVTDELSLAAGLDLYWAKSAVLNSSVARLEGDGYGWGYNLSALYRRGPLSIGGSFHSAATVAIDGDYEPSSQNLVLLGQLQAAQAAELDLDLPWRLQLGLRWAFTERLAVEADWSRTGWSEFDSIEIKGKSSGAIIQEDINDWSDANAYRLGITYHWRPTTVLRAGYAYDETGQGDTHFSARVPDHDRHLFSLGIGQILGNGWSIDAGYLYVLFEDRDYQAATPYTGGAEINGTDAIDGEYEASAHLLGIEVRRVF